MGTTLQSEVKSCPIRALDIPGRGPLPSLWHLLLFSCRGNWPTKTYLHITHSRVQAMTNGFHFLIIDWWYLDTPDCPNWLRDKILFIFIFSFRSGGGEWGCHQLYIQVYLTKYNPWPNRLCLGFSLPTRTIGSTHLSPADILLSWPGFWRFILLSIYLVLFRFIFCLHNLLSPQKHLNYGSWPDMKPPSPARISGEYYGPAAICIRFVNLPGQLQNSYKTLFN